MMGSAAAVIQTFQTDEWNAKVFGALSIASNLAALVKKKANVLHLAYSLNKINRQLGSMFDEVYGVTEGKINVEVKEEITEAKAREFLHDLMRLYRAIENSYERMRRAGLLNNSLISGQLLKLRAHGDAILDLADFVETSFNTEEVNALFARASEEREHGELYDLEQVQ